MKKKTKKPWVAAILSLSMSGMGQVYNRDYDYAYMIWGVTIFFIIIEMLVNYNLSGIFLGISIYAAYQAYKSSKLDKNNPNMYAVWIVLFFYIILILGVLIYNKYYL